MEMQGSKWGVKSGVRVLECCRILLAVFDMWLMIGRRQTLFVRGYLSSEHLDALRVESFRWRCDGDFVVDAGRDESTAWLCQVKLLESWRERTVRTQQNLFSHPRESKHYTRMLVLSCNLLHGVEGSDYFCVEPLLSCARGPISIWRFWFCQNLFGLWITYHEPCHSSP